MRTQQQLQSRHESGFRIFDDGEIGAAHSMAHRLLDGKRYEEGWFRLGWWLERHSDLATGPEGAHLHWHMAVFEIAVQRPDEAHRRFLLYVAPLVEKGWVLTDAPSLLWRLRLAGTKEKLDWNPTRRIALVNLWANPHSRNRYVLLHQLLALAGARDTASIDRWLDRRYDLSCALSEGTAESVFLRSAWALRTFANRDYEPAAKLLRCARQIDGLGGSSAQNQLFGHIHDRARELGRQRVA